MTALNANKNKAFVCVAIDMELFSAYKTTLQIYVYCVSSLASVVYSVRFFNEDFSLWHLTFYMCRFLLRSYYKTENKTKGH